MAACAAVPVAASAALRRRAGALSAYVGCFTTAQRYARGDGIRVYRVEIGNSVTTFWWDAERGHLRPAHCRGSG